MSLERGQLVRTSSVLAKLSRSEFLRANEQGPQTLNLVYDRGTILLRVASEYVDAIRNIPEILWDARVGAFRARAFQLQQIRHELRARQIEFQENLRSPESCPQPLPWSIPELRPYQEAALMAWQLAGERGVIVLPTGAGKTRLALAAMARTGQSTLCLVPTRVLFHQWLDQIRKVYSGPMGMVGDGFHAVHAISVATYESAYRHMSRLGNLFDLLIVDEAHHFGCGIRDEALEMSLATKRLGLTATPPRDEKSMDGLTFLLGSTVFELAIDDLVGSFLADFELIVIQLELSPAERRAYEMDLKAFREVHSRFQSLVPNSTWSQFAQAAARSPEGREALHAWQRIRKQLSFTQAKAHVLGTLLSRHRDARVLVFTADNETAYTIARHHLIMPLTCDIGKKERDAVLARFRTGELKALVSARVLNEGLDVPDADVAIIVAGTQGEREYVQRVGRLLRPAPGKQAVIYELIHRGTIEVRQAMRRRIGLGPRKTAELQHQR